MSLKGLIDCLLAPGQPRCIRGLPTIPHPFRLAIIAGDNRRS